MTRRELSSLQDIRRVISREDSKAQRKRHLGWRVLKGTKILYIIFIVIINYLIHKVV